MIAPSPIFAGAVIATLALAGCASADEPAPPAVASPSPSASPSQTAATPTEIPPASATSAVRTIAVSIRAGKIDPPPGRVQVSRGEKVRIVVTSDKADELHVHGFDLEKALPAGQPATVEFVADQPGLFEAEAHELDKVLFQLQVS